MSNDAHADDTGLSCRRPAVDCASLYGDPPGYPISLRAL